MAIIPRVVLTLSICTLMIPFISAQKMGYVWANDSTANEYIPSATYSYNSSGGDINIKRRNTGSYEVTFSGLGGQGEAGGNVQLTPYGSTRNTCNVVRWSSRGRDFVVYVDCFDTSGNPADSQYSLSVMWPPSERVSGEQPTGQASSDSEPTRIIEDDGTVELRYPNGKVVERFSGGIRIRHPDGSMESRLFVQSRPRVQPALPDPAETEWLEFYSETLLGIIRSLVNNDDASIQNYLEHEGEDASLYKRVAMRLETIDFLLFS